MRNRSSRLACASERELGEGISALEDLAGARSVTAILSVLREHAKLPA